MRKQSWDSLVPNFKDYAYTAAVGNFVERAGRELRPLALILFGSLARGDYHQYSDADFCLILAGTPRSPFEGYDRAVACDPTGVIQPLVYGPDQFRQMVAQANGLALEVMADGFFLAGDETFRQELEQLMAATRQRLGLERTPTGWRLSTTNGEINEGGRGGWWQGRLSRKINNQSSHPTVIGISPRFAGRNDMPE